MSLVGNFTQNYDRSSQQGGSSLRRAHSNVSYHQDDTVHSSGQEKSHLPTIPQGSTQAYPATDGALYPSGGSDNDQSSTPMSMTDTLHSRTQQITSLARNMSRRSEQGNLFDYEEGSDLDPFSNNFDAPKWTRQLASMREEGAPGRKAGLAYKNMSVHGFGSDADYQKTVSNMPLSWAGAIRDRISGRKRKVQILNGIDGVLDAGEMLVVLGPPGSGCSTMLKTIAGEMNGIYLEEESELNYRGITPKQMLSQFRGEAIYTAEVDVHFPKLTVGDTLSFAAEARAPRNPPAGLTQPQFARHLRNVIMSVFGISHTVNSIVGNDFVRGVSGGERKRVTIAEAALSGAPLQCWDNSTRGLDSANAIEFVKNLKMGAEYMGTTSVVAIYQAPGSAYDLFDKVAVLYEGEQIYFGKTTDAKQYFLDMGFFCPEQQTTPDFLTSLTSASERTPREGFEGKVPTTPQEFASAWRKSNEYQRLMQDIEEFNHQHPVKGQRYDDFLASRRAQQSKHISAKSPYTLSYGQQIKLCLKRGFWRLKADPSLTFFQLFGNSAMALILGSVFYNMPETTDSFRSRGATLFFAVLLNAFGAALEILTLYAQRNIVEKHVQYAFYHSSAEAFASMLTDLPYKIVNSIFFNLIIYFLPNLRREPGPFFFFYLISFFATLMMSMFFRTVAATSRTLVQALTPAAVIILGLVMYTGFAIPTTYMLGWSRWINYINPIAYAFEALMINEFNNREFACSAFVPQGPQYANVPADSRICSTLGATPGSNVVQGSAYIIQSYAYYPSHRWRNFGILVAFTVFFLMTYLVATEYISAQKSKGEVLVFQRGRIPKALKDKKNADAESGGDNGTVNAENVKQGEGGKVNESIIQRQTAIFSWKDVVYDIKIKKETRRILDHVDGWVKPGTLTALMGVSGAGKTTLLDVLATRVTMGVVTGEMLVDGRQRDVSFQRKTGYVQQQDLHLETSTVREALRFSAILRQSKKVPMKEKLEYVEEVLKLLEMDSYADAVVGVPGEGLNVEQRKRLTIGVELVAKPALLLFLDEPTSGLDSQTSWNILQLLRKLTEHGQAILCTIHQPSAMLFEQFDRLLFLAKGGRTVYFGEVGAGSQKLIDYFVKTGAPPCPPGENPAEWMLSAIGAAPGSHTDVDWHQAWMDSKERVAVRQELQNLKDEGLKKSEGKEEEKKDKSAYTEFAAPFGVQFLTVFIRVSQQLWRTPSYIYSKMFLSIIVGLFVGFSFFKADTSQQGLANQLFSVFLLFTMFGQLVQQIMPQFVTQRSLYEVRERPAKVYSWKVFILSYILIEVLWSVLVGTILFFCWYYPIGYYRNAIPTDTVHVRGALMWLYVMMFMVFTATFAVMAVAGQDTAENAGNLANLAFSLSLIFCGVLQPAENLPGFWIFMYRVSPFTYFVEGMLGVAVADTLVECSPIEYLTFEPANGQSCEAYMAPYIATAGGYLRDTAATSNCEFCALRDTNTFLTSFGLNYGNRWRNFGILWAYCIVNIIGAILFYWIFRVPKNSGKEKPTEDGTPEPEKKIEGGAEKQQQEKRN